MLKNLELKSTDSLNPDTLNSNTKKSNTNVEDKFKAAPVSPYHSTMTFEEKKKLSWKEKIPSPNRDTSLIKKKLSERTLAKYPLKEILLELKIKGSIKKMLLLSRILLH